MNEHRDSPDVHSSRRRFLKTSAGTLAAVQLPGVGEAAPSSGAEKQLAIDGGEKAVTRPNPERVRWGDPERHQLSEMIDQKSLFYWNGPRTQLLLDRFQSRYPLSHVQPCSSGTAAIHIALNTAGIGPGDEVITSPITDMGTVIGILYQQGVPVFADLGATTYNLNPVDVEQRITPRTKAILPVHLTGNPCPMDELNELARQHGLVVIEDCAQAWGTLYRGKPVGTLGDFGCYSLNDFKHIGCGDGGIVASSHPEYGPQLQKFGDKGYDRVKGTRSPEFLAPNYRMSEPQAAVAAAQMQRLTGIADQRNRLGTLLTSEISDLDGIMPHGVDSRDKATYWFYMLRIDPQAFRCDLATLIRALRAEGVPSAGGYIPAPLYAYDVFQNHNFFHGVWPAREMGLTDMDYRTVHCPQAEAILKTAIRIFIHEAMDEQYVRQLAAAVRKVSRHFHA